MHNRIKSIYYYYYYYLFIKALNLYTWENYSTKGFLKMLSQVTTAITDHILGIGAIFSLNLHF